jgi:RNA ligase
MNISEVISRFDIPVVEVFESFNTVNELLEYTRGLVGVEGFVGAFPDGHRFKAKAELYVAMHQIKDDIRTERNIAKAIVEETLDDILPLLDETDYQIVCAYEKRFDDAIHNVLGRLEGLVTLARVLHGGVKKDVAINFVPNLVNKEDASFIFSALDGKELRPLVIKKIRDSVGNGSKYDAMMRWLEA